MDSFTKAEYESSLTEFAHPFHSPMKTRSKIISYVSAWLLALFAVEFNFGLWAVAWMFPLGIYAFFFPEHRQQTGSPVMIACVGIYVLHAILFFRTRQMRSTIVYFAILVLLLVANISGCRGMIHAH